jgi:hypothetical protein
MRVRLTSNPDGSIVLEATYREWNPVREDFKAAIPWDCRRWDDERKRWIISALYVADLLQFPQRVGAQVQDDRTPETLLLERPAIPDDLRQAFATLHVAYTAPLRVAEAAFRGLSKVYHPDHDGSEEQFCAIADAIAVIRRYLSPIPGDPNANNVPF